MLKEINLDVIHSGVAHKSPIGPSAVSEALNITNKENNVKSEPPSSHDFKNRRFPSGFSYFSNCLSKQGVVFLGRPCGLMPATSCGGFNCASGIGFPISTVCCSWVSCREANQPGRGINAAKRFDITSLPAHPSALSAKIRPKPFKDKRRRKHKHSKPKTYGHQSAKEGPKIDVELKLNDEPKAEAQDEVPVVQPQGVLGQPVHHRPWLPYMHRPLHPFNMRYHPHFFPHYMHHNMRFQHPSYWRFQGYFPHFMRMRAPWGINPSDMTNIHRYPEYQFGDVQFVQPNHPFRYSRPPFRDVNDFSSDVKLLDRPEKLHEHLMHSKNKIKNHNEYNGLHEEDRKMVNDSEDSKEPFKWDKYKQRGAEHEKEPNTGIREEQDVLHFNPTENEDEETNYPEYKSEFNTNRLWPSVEKRQGKIYNHFRFHKPEKEESAIFREFTPANLGFDLDDISTSHSKRKQQSKEGQKTDGVGHKVSSGVGVVKIKSDSAVIVNAIKAFA